MKERVKLTKESIQQIALKHSTRISFKHKNPSAYQKATQLGILQEVCQHMTPSRVAPRTVEDIQKEALKYNTRSEFQKKSKGAYLAAFKRGILDSICSHMVEPQNKPWTYDELKEEALKYSTKKDFRKANRQAYDAMHNRGWIKELCTHMVPIRRYWDKEQLKKEALKYTNRSDFAVKSAGAYNTAIRLKILEEVCLHMKVVGGISKPEEKLFNLIRQSYPKAQKLRDRKVSIPNKPHITGFEIDIYIPELRKGIEFNGTYWHSLQGLKRGRPNWPQDDLENYHLLKTEHFNKRGIQILTIDEKEWLQDPDACLEKIKTFLS